MGNSLDLVTFTIPSNLYFAQFADGGGLFSQIILYALQNERDTKALISLKGIGGQPQTVDLNGEDVEGELEVMIPAGRPASLQNRWGRPNIGCLGHSDLRCAAGWGRSLWWLGGTGRRGKQRGTGQRLSCSDGNQ